MRKDSEQSLCTSAEWLGRAQCEKCHIRQVMFFSELPESAFGKLLQPIDHYIFSSGSVLYEANSDKKFLFSIRQGMVKLVHETRDGSCRIVRLLGPGSVIGLELLEGAPGYHHTAIAVDQVDLCKIPLATVSRLQSEYPTLCKHVGQQLQKQLDLADQWIVALSTGSAKQRVAQLLLIMEEFFADENDSFILLSREDMAAMIGIAVETVSRMIAGFKRQKILFRSKDNRFQCNVTKLQQITRCG